MQEELGLVKFDYFAGNLEKKKRSFYNKQNYK